VEAVPFTLARRSPHFRRLLRCDFRDPLDARRDARDAMTVLLET
jgi:hypothetical protein